MTSSSPSASPSSHGAVRGAARLFNPLVLHFAGTRVMPLYGVITHRGRRSGKPFHTPVVVRPTSTGFIVPMPWGEGTDWYRNVQAAGECAIRWKGNNYRMTNPQVVDSASVSDQFSAVQRAGLSRFGIARFLVLSYR